MEKITLYELEPPGNIIEEKETERYAACSFLFFGFFVNTFKPANFFQAPTSAM